MTSLIWGDAQCFWNAITFSKNKETGFNPVNNLYRFNYQAISVDLPIILFMIDDTNALARRGCNNHINAIIAHLFPLVDFLIYLLLNC